MIEHLDWVYLPILWWGSYRLAHYKADGWIWKLVGGIIGGVWAWEMKLGGMFFWNCLFMIVYVIGARRWKNKEG